MLSKEEIEKDIKILKDISECITYSMWSEDTEALRRVLQYIEQLETKNQKLIEKLEEDIEQNYCDGKYEGNFRKSVWQDEYAQEILEIAKGENGDSKN